MGTKKKDRKIEIHPINGKWTPEVFRDYETDWLLMQTWDCEEDDWQMAYYTLLEELAIRALQDGSILDDVIEALGRHMQVFQRISMGMPLARPGLEQLLEHGGKDIRQRLIDHANDWDVERQINFYGYFSPDTRGEDDRVLAEQVNLEEIKEKYGFKPKFGIKGWQPDWRENGPLIVHFYDLESSDRLDQGS